MVATAASYCTHQTNTPTPSFPHRSFPRNRAAQQKKGDPVAASFYLFIAMAEEDQPSAVEVEIERLSTVLEAKIAEHGENHLLAAPAYVEYARALLHKAQSEDDPLGGALKKDKEAGGGGGGGASSGGSAGAGSSSDANAAEGANADEPADDAEEDEEDEGGEADGEEGEEADDLELAFQCFEVARLIYEKAGAEHEGSLADVLEGIGEVSMENEMWDDAIAELEKSLTIKRRIYGPDDRQVAHLHYQVATAAVAQVEKAKHDLAQPPPPTPDAEPVTPESCAATIQRCQGIALLHYSKAAGVLESRLKSLSGKENSGENDTPSGEAAELAELLAEVRERAEEQQQQQQQSGASGADGSKALPDDAAAPSGVTTIGFGAPSSTTIGFGAPASTTIGFGAPAAATASTGFGAPSTAAMPVKNLGVVGGSKGSKKRVRLDE